MLLARRRLLVGAGASSLFPYAAFAARNGTALLDGSATSTGASPQLPTILNGYPKRPPWQVAGVDYGVGPPNSQSFLNSANLAANFPSGVTVVNTAGSRSIT